MKNKIDLTKVKIKTEKLLLLPINYTYTEEIFQHFNKDITLYMFPAPAKQIEETKAFIGASLTKLANGTTLQLVITINSTNEFIGCAGLHEIDSKRPELGIWLKKNAHGNGYGLKTITEMIKWSRENIDFEYLVYPVDKRNPASRRIPERNGGIIKREFKIINQAGFELDEIEYWIYK